MRPPDVPSLVRDRVIDAELAALLWLLVEGGVPLVVAGPAGRSTRMALAVALLSLDPSRAWVVLDADDQMPDAQRLAALLRGGASVGITLTADDLEAVLQRLVSAGLPEDGVRRLGVVVMAEETEAGPRCRVVHYLRPTERDAQGHVQRRPPAVLSALDPASDRYEHYAWGITPELADRVDRAQADLEERQQERALFLGSSAADVAEPEAATERVRRYLAAEPEHVPAPKREAVRPSPFSGGLTDPDPHRH